MSVALTMNRRQCKFYRAETIVLDSLFSGSVSDMNVQGT